MKSWRGKLSNLKNSVQMLYPDCCGCGEPSLEFLCSVCAQELHFHDACKVCGIKLAKGLFECMPCSKTLRPWGDLQIAYKYEGGIRDLILDIKNNHKPERWRELKTKHLPDLQAKNYSVLVSASSDPLHFRKRLFDPAYELARHLSNLWNIKLSVPLFDRKIFLKSQKELDKETREKFLKNIISLNAQAQTQKHDHILLIDDIMTTGATLRVHVKLLKTIAERVSVFCLARSLKTS